MPRNESRNSFRPDASKAWVRRPMGFILALVLLLLAFTLGGSARGDAPQLVALRPLSIIILAAALWNLKWEHVQAHRALFVVIIAAWAILIVSLIPLPPALWTGLPGRELMHQIDIALGNGGLWRPLSMTPAATHNAVFALAVPTALVVLVARLDRREMVAMLPAVTAIAALTALVAYLQAFGLAGRFYPISNVNAGLFANRNHHALVLACLVPMILTVVVASRGHAPRERSRLLRRRPSERALWPLFWLCIFLLIPLVILAGSRAGIALMALAALSCLILIRYAPVRNVPGSPLLLRVGGGGFVALIFAGLAWALLGSDRDVAFDRLFTKDVSGDLRFPVWKVTVELIGQYMPFGTGPGSFVEVYQIAEPQGLLQDDYINHAHNDWLEVVLTGGVPAAALLIAILALFFMAVLRLARARSAPNGLLLYNCLGLSIVGLCGAASVVDYPLRTPAIACLFVYAAFLASLGSSEPKPGAAGGAELVDK